MHSANSVQVGGTHYAAGVQHWDYVVGALRSRYLEGNVTKYVARHRKKNGLQDLQKAQHYLRKLTELLIDETIQPFCAMGTVPEMPSVVLKFCKENSLNYHEMRVMILAASWRGTEDLAEMENEINILIRAASENADAEPGAGYVAQGQDKPMNCGGARVDEQPSMATELQTSSSIDVHFVQVGSVSELVITGCTTDEEAARLAEFFLYREQPEA